MGKENKPGSVVECYQIYSSCVFTFLLGSLFSVFFVCTSVTVKSENKISRKQGRTIVWPQSPCAIGVGYGKGIPS